ncbi:MAG: HlyD family secretion protein [Rhodospirillaceae bacterium]
MKHILAVMAVLTLAGCGDDTPILNGYAEGEFVLLAPETSGRIAQMTVAEGATVQACAPLFSLDAAAETLSLEAARARAAAATARFDDAAAGGRTPEIIAAREQLAQARAAQVRARADRARAQELASTGVIPRARLDEAVAAAESADARVSEARQRVTLAELPARENQIKALAASAEEAEQQVRLAEDAVRRRTVASPAAGRIERILRYAGDVAGPAAPAVRFLPDGRVIAVLFIPEPALAKIHVGTRLAITCDGCAAAAAEIVSVADETEFTPPIIYSDTERTRLVYRAEARFTGFVPPPGTPLRAEVQGTKARNEK